MDIIQQDHSNSFLRAHLRVRDDGPLVIGIAGYGFIDKPDIWGRPWFEKHGFNYLSVTPLAEHWYPEAAMELPDEMMEVCRRASRRATYGYSMGGHAALKFADHFGAEIAVAIAPQYSIDPAIVPDQRYNKYFGDTCGTHHLIDRATRAHRYILFDPAHAADIAHVSLILKHNPATIVPTFGAEHDVYSALASRNMYDAIADIILGRFDLDEFIERYEART